MEEYLKRGYKLSVAANTQINYLKGALILEDFTAVRDLKELTEENLKFLIDTNIAEKLYKGGALNSIYNSNEKLFISSIAEKKYNGKGITYESIISSSATTLTESLFKLEKELGEGKKHVKR